MACGTAGTGRRLWPPPKQRARAVKSPVPSAAAAAAAPTKLDKKRAARTGVVEGAQMKVCMAVAKGPLCCQSGEVFFVAGSLLEAKVAQIEKRKHGFTMLFSYLLFTAIFFAIIVLQKSPAQAFNVERALVDLVLDVQLPDDSTLEEIHDTESILPWVSALIDRCGRKNNHISV